MEIKENLKIDYKNKNVESIVKDFIELQDFADDVLLYILENEGYGVYEIARAIYIVGKYKYIFNSIVNEHFEINR